MSLPEPSLVEPLVCAGCGTQHSQWVLACPACGRLVHADKLKTLASEAEAAAANGDAAAALDRWRTALTLVPPGTRQADAISAKVDALVKETDNPVSQANKSPVPKVLASLGTVGLLLWKFKFVLVFLLTKGKLLLLGLTKASTFLSMFATLGLYSSLWGWKFALGVVGSIYVHEMGHVAALRRLGFKADAPMFVPGLGAFVRLRQRPSNPREDARIGLAGPIWGLAASIASYGIGTWLDAPMWLAIGKWSAMINLFNLLPVFSLDGARGFAALSKQERWLATATVGAAWFLSGENLLILLLGVCAFASFRAGAPEEGDRRTLVTWVVLVAALSWIATQHVPG